MRIKDKLKKSALIIRNYNGIRSHFAKIFNQGSRHNLTIKNNTVVLCAVEMFDLPNLKT